MASFVNIFALLEGDATAQQAPTGKKKKSKKAKKLASTNPPAAQTDASATHAHPPERESADDDGFQMAGKTSRRHSTSSSKPPSGVASPQQPSVSEGITGLLGAASRVPIKHPAERVELWTSWQQQVLKHKQADRKHHCCCQTYCWHAVQRHRTRGVNSFTKL